MTEPNFADELLRLGVSESDSSILCSLHKGGSYEVVGKEFKLTPAQVELRFLKVLKSLMNSEAGRDLAAVIMHDLGDLF